MKDIDRGYMISPLSLTERQMLIYRALYSRCNFESMTVALTLGQIRGNIRLIDLSEKVIYLEIKKMMKAGYIEQLRPKSKGNAPVYRLVRFAPFAPNVGKLKGSQREVKGKLKHSNPNGLGGDMGSNWEVNGKLTGSTIIEREIESNNIGQIAPNDLNNLWSLYPNKKGKKEAFNKIPKLIKEHGYEEIENCIKRYLKEIEVNKIEKQYIQQGKTFFKSGYVDYLEENYSLEEADKPKDNLRYI